MTPIPFRAPGFVLTPPPARARPSLWRRLRCFVGFHAPERWWTPSARESALVLQMLHVAPGKGFYVARWACEHCRAHWTTVVRAVWQGYYAGPSAVRRAEAWATEVDFARDGGSDG